MIAVYVFMNVIIYKEAFIYNQDKNYMSIALLIKFYHC